MTGGGEGRPRIGITCSPRRATGYYDPYLRAIEAAGAEAVVIAPVTDPGHEDVERILGAIDGLIVPGGWDVSPQEYGGAPVAELTPLDRDLDRTEIALVRGSRTTATPVLGICRGQQLINVALGGTLHQHIEGHDVRDRPRSALVHEVVVDPDSELARLTASPVLVNSIHHQAVDELAAGLRATAHSHDHIIEAFESDDGLIVAVQSHPEELTDEVWARSLFERFVARTAQGTLLSSQPARGD